ncbi:MAG: protein kinase, partial [Planctomycetales bacterium]|nr:protein kinase [Planctomycetales bacterium]
LRDTHRANSELYHRWVEEAQIGARLQHPGIIPVYGLGHLPDGRPFIAMKLVIGKTLSLILKERTESRRKLLGIFEQICHALAYAHDQGVIHRDLKPSNVMVGMFGEVQVMDWGLAKSIRSNGPEPPSQISIPDLTNGVVHQIETRAKYRTETETRFGDIIGTPAYMAPEQALGEVERVDERTDVFALGAILFEMITGTSLYSGKSREDVHRQAMMAERTAAWQRLDDSECDAELHRLIQDCLAVDQADRPADAGQIAQRISDYLESLDRRLRDSEIAAARLLAIAEEERKRRKLSVALIGSVAVGGMLVLASWAWFAALRANEAGQANNVAFGAVSHAESLAQQAFASVDDRLWDQANIATQEAIVLTGGRFIRSDLAEKANRLAERVELERRIRAFRDELSSIWDRQNELRFDGNLDSFDEVNHYRQAFANFGVVMETDAISDAAMRLKIISTEDRIETIAVLDWLAGKHPVESALADWCGTLAAEIDEDPWRQALRHACQHDDAETLQRLTLEIDFDTQPIPLVTLLSYRLADAGQLDLANQLLLSAQQAKPEDHGVNRQLGYWEFAQANYDEAARFFSVAVALRPRSAAAKSDLGVALAKSGNLTAAAHSLKQAAEMDHRDADVWRNYAAALRQAGQLSEAESALRRAIDLDPSGDKFRELGALYRRMRKLDQAVDSLQQAVALDPNNPDLHFGLGLAAYLNKQDQLALASLERTMVLDQKHRDATALLGHVLVRLGDTDRAREVFRSPLLSGRLKADAKTPDHPKHQIEEQ